MICDEFDEAFQSLETEVFKIGLLSNWLVYHEGIPEHMAVFLGAFFQTIDYLQQSFDEVKVLLHCITNPEPDSGEAVSPPLANNERMGQSPGLILDNIS